MRIVGRYFAVGASLGSVTSLVTLVLIWSWMTIHLGLLGFLVGWIPAGLAAAAVWLVMVVFWGPILVLAAMIVTAVLIWSARGGRERAWREPSEASEPERPPPPPAIETSPDRDVGAAPPPPALAPPVAPAPVAPTDSALPPAAAPLSPPPVSTTPRPRSQDDLGGDAAAAGDTSRKRPQ